ncbi:MAG: hypothetical protein DDT21_00117 [Syntrophomonadaceae bacterium]|nr:hypothetical protein [Bacillota bacterium]
MIQAKRLQELGFTLILTEVGKVQVRYTGDGEAPAEAEPLLDELKASKAEAVRFLQAAGTGADADAGAAAMTVLVKDRVVRLQPWRTACQESGFCRRFTVEADCMLFPVLPGLCRERVRA